MGQRLLCLMGFVLVLAAAGSASATDFQWDADTDSDWHTHANWDPCLAGYPDGSDDNAYFQADANGTTCVVDSVAACGALSGPGYSYCVTYDANGDITASAPSVLTISGATLTVHTIMQAGWDDDDTSKMGYGILNMEPGGVLDCSAVQCWLGSRGLMVTNMNGGTIYAKGFNVGFAGGGSSLVNLDLGTIDANGFSIYTVGEDRVDIQAGTLIMVGLRKDSLIRGYATDGRLTAYDGRGKLTAVETTDPNRTTVTAIEDVNIAYDPEPAAGSSSVVHDASLGWKIGTGALTHDVYLSDNFDDVNDAVNNGSVYCIAADIAVNYVTNPLLKFNVTHYWRVDENDGTTVHKGNIWCFSTDNGKAGLDEPANVATDVNTIDLALEWTRKPGRVPYAVQHNVYLSEIFEDVNTAAPGSATPPCISFNQGPNTITISQLKLDTTYYWRVDEVTTDPCTVRGDVWDFTTSNYYLIEDFERYSTNPANPLYLKNFWSGTGATEDWYDLNDEYPHTGLKAVRIQYWTYDSPYYCGVGRTETPWVPADWTFEGSAETLSLWFRVDDEILTPTDNADELYVRLKDSSDREATVQYSDNWPVSNLQIDGYHEWNIVLTEFIDDNPNIDLTHVKMLEMGIGDGFDNPVTIPGEGDLYFDDIRLYPRRCILKYGQPEGDIDDDCVVDARDVKIMADDWLDYDYSVTGVPVAPDDPNLVAHWKLDESDLCTVAVDSSGNGHHGDLFGFGVWDPNGRIGGAIELPQSGSVDYIDCGGGKNKGEPNTWADIEGDITVMAWVKPYSNMWWRNLSNIISKGRESAWNLHKSWRDGPYPRTASFYVKLNGQECPWYGVPGRTDLFDNRWHHVTGVYKIYEPGVSSEVMLYTDGAKEGSLACFGTAVHTNHYSVFIGADYSFIMWPHAWWGFIDDARIYDRALSQAEIVGIIKEAPSGPVAHYEFESESGGVTPDSSGGHDGTLVNGASIVYDADRDGNVLELDGVDQYVDCGGGHDLSEPNCTDEPGNCTWADITGDISIMAWVKPDISESGNYRVVVVGKGDDGGYHRDYPGEPNRPREGWSMLRLDWDNIVTASITGTPDNFTPVRGIEPEIDVNIWDGRWHHIAAVSDYLTACVHLYIDGVIANECWTIGEPTSLSTTNYPIWIGANVGEVMGGGAHGDGYHGWKGCIDDVRIYDHALTQAEVATAMAGGDLYMPLESLANLYDEEMVNRKIINFKDYQILADGWLEDETFPFKE